MANSNSQNGFTKTEQEWITRIAIVNSQKELQNLITMLNSDLNCGNIPESNTKGEQKRLTILYAAQQVQYHI